MVVSGAQHSKETFLSNSLHNETYLHFVVFYQVQRVKGEPTSGNVRTGTPSKIRNGLVLTPGLRKTSLNEARSLGPLSRSVYKIKTTDLRG